MKGYFNKLLIYIVVGVVITFLLWSVNSGIFLETKQMNTDIVKILEQPKNCDDTYSLQEKMLIIYSENNNNKLVDNIKRTCDWLKISYETVQAQRCDCVSFVEYDCVIIATNDIEYDLGNELGRVIRYVENGGKLFWAVAPYNLTDDFLDISQELGITEINNYKLINGYYFKEELMPGSKGLKYDDEQFEDSVVSLQVSDKAKVYVTDSTQSLPLVWSYNYGEGSIVFYNGTSLASDFYTGMIGGCIASLYDNFMYPIINAKVVYIDDFPSLQYNSESDVIKDEYNRTVKEFYRDIWWPDIQSVAKKYDLSYTGLFMATYDNEVNPLDFNYIKDDMEQYYGNSLLKNGFELGAHGYNHQSLTLAGGTPEEMEYKPWKNTEDMTESIKELKSITESLFGSVKLFTYVPPSNYLSKEGREAVIKALPDLKVISGVYTNEGESGDVYKQSFEIAKDGIAEFPRISAGMLKDQYEDFIILNGCSLYGVFSHFIHPDDILDKDRGNGETWEQLLDNFCEKINFVNQRFSGLRALTSSAAADALKIAYNDIVYIETIDNRIVGEVKNFYGESYFFLKTDKKPISSSSTCTITSITDDYESNYYLVNVTDTHFTIDLDEN